MDRLNTHQEWNPPWGRSKVSKHTCMFCDGTGKQKVEPVAEEEEQPVKDPGSIL